MVNLHRVLNRNFEQFLVRVGRERHCAIHFAGIFATIDEFPSHPNPPQQRAIAVGFGLNLPPFRSPDKAESVRFRSGAGRSEIAASALISV